MTNCKHSAITFCQTNFVRWLFATRSEYIATNYREQCSSQNIRSIFVRYSHKDSFSVREGRNGDKFDHFQDRYDIIISLWTSSCMCLTTIGKCWVHRFSLEKSESLDIRSNSGKQHSQFSQNSFSFCVWHCIWQAVRIQMKCRIRCGISSGSTLSAKKNAVNFYFMCKP